MAEIFRARLATLDKNGRFVVIKRIMGEYSNNIEFVGMFKAEVQVTMRFNHPNIVQIFDSGEEQGQPYIAMEFIDGRNLRQILSRASQKNQPVSLAAACYIIEQSAAGLHYAHAFKDMITGEPLNLVHRDVSPQNILVSYDGNIKVIDFGIAKAATNGENTRAGVIKGKLSYLSPEQVLGETLDGRSDIFALGIVLWETLTGKRLFVSDSDNEYQVLKMIEACTTFVKPPSTFNPEIPAELDEVVMQALARDPRKRFQSGEELSRALRRILATKFSDFGPSDLSQFIKKMFHDVIVEDRKNLQTVNARADELITLGIRNPEKEKTATNLNHVSGAPGAKADHTRMTQFLGDRFDQSQLNEAEKVEVAGTPSRQMKVGAGTAEHSGKTNSKNFNRAGREPGTRSISMPRPITAKESGGVPGVVKFAVVAAGVGAAVYFGGFVPEIEKMIRPDKKVAAVETPREPVNQVAGKRGKLRLNLPSSAGASGIVVTVNSQDVPFENGVVEIPIGEPINLNVVQAEHVPFTKEFTVQQSELDANGELKLDVVLDSMSYGLFSISTRPAVADVSIVKIDRQPSEVAKPLEFKTPIHQEKIPAGNYRVTVKNDLLGVEKVMTVEIKEGKEVVLTDVKLDVKN